MFEGMPRRASDSSKHEEIDSVYSDTQERNGTNVESVQKLTSEIDSALKTEDVEALQALQPQIHEKVRELRELQDELPNDDVVRRSISLLSGYRGKVMEKLREIKEKIHWREAA